MTFNTPTGSRWPVRLAYIAAFLFTLASGGTNLIYGWQKGTDIPTALVWAGVSLGVSIVFALSWPALIKCLDCRQWGRAVVVAIALLMTGAYSVSAALGSAMGGRVNAESAQTTAAKDRARAQTAYDLAEKELAKLPATRSVVEVETLLENARPVCRVQVHKGNRQTVCAKPPALETELARAKSREKQKAAMDKASDELRGLGAGKVANSDAVALQAYLDGLGVSITADRLNKFLVLLAVLVVECGGGLSLAVAMSLSGQPGHLPDTPVSGRTNTAPDSGTRAPDTSPKDSSINALACPPAPDTPALPAPDTFDKTAAGVRFLAFLTERGGVLVSGQRQMGQALGWSKSWTHEVLHHLSSAGLIRLTTSKAGTVVQLPAAA